MHFSLIISFFNYSEVFCFLDRFVFEAYERIGRIELSVFVRVFVPRNISFRFKQQ